MSFLLFLHSTSEISINHTVSLQQCIAYYSNIIQTMLCNFTLSNVDVMQSTGVEFTVAHSAVTLPFSNLGFPSEQKVVLCFCFHLEVYDGSVCS